MSTAMTLKIQGGHKLQGTVTPSGSKNSIVALVPATLLFSTPVTLRNVPEITDVKRLIEILESMGSQIAWDKTAKTLSIDNSSINYDPITPKDIKSTKGIRGTTLLWGPMLAKFKKAESSEQPAGCTLGARPIDAHFQAFIDLGVTVKTDNNQVILDATSAKPNHIWLLETSVTATENAVMLATALTGTTTISNAASEPHVQDLCNFLIKCGAKITGVGSNILTIEGGHPLSPQEHSVIPDIYEVGTFLALGALTQGEIRVENALPEHMTGIVREFAKFGIEINFEGTTAIVKNNQTPEITKTKSPMIVRAQPWPALPVDMLPLFIPLALKSPKGQALFHNWMYESGLYWTSELQKLGANLTMCDPHRVIVTGGNKLVGTQLDAPYIIRAVISMVMAAMIATGETTILNADSIHRGHPDFVKNLQSLGAQIEEI